MNILKIFVILVAGSIATSVVAETPNCSALVAEVGHYLNDTVHNKQMMSKAEDWKNISWVQKQMGQGTKEEVINKTYLWNSFGLVTVNDNVIAKIGTVPDKLKKASLTVMPDLETTLNTLGKPSKIITKTFYRYSWICPDSSSNLIVNATIMGRVLSVAGISCTNDLADSTNSENCVGFSSLQQGQQERLY